MGISLVGYIKIHTYLAEILLGKIFSLRPKPKYSLRKPSMVPLDKGLQWVNKEQKLFRKVLAHSVYPGIIQACSEPCVTLAHLEPWYNQNPYILRAMAYSQPWYIQSPQ